MKRGSLFIFSCFFLVCTFLFAQEGSVPALTRKQRNVAKWNVPGGNYSGITRVGDNEYVLVSDCDKTLTFYNITVDVDSLDGDVLNVSYKGKTSGRTKVADVEDVAFVPFLNTFFVCDEGRQCVEEYDRDGEATGRSLDVPESFGVRMIYGNYGFESLCYSPHDTLLWTVTEHTLRGDGERSDASNRRGCVLRLLGFSPVSCALTNECLYRTECPKVRKAGRSYAFGVSAMTALCNGSLLVMEREFHVARRYLGSYVTTSVFRVCPDDVDEDGFLRKSPVTSFKTRLNVTRRNLSNYEGMCTSVTLSDGRQVLLLVSDSQNNYGNFFYRMKDYVKSVVIDLREVNKP